MKLFRTFAVALAAAAFSVAAIAQTAPQVGKVNDNDLFQDVVNGQPSAQSKYASALTLAGYVGGLPTKGNVLIGGDATTNLWQRATTGASVTTTATYGGPDRFFYWSGTSTAMTVSRTSTAADLPAQGFTYGFKMARTASQTGVVQTCMAQVVESANAAQFQGQTAELSFYATAGATFSAASSAMKAYIVYGTGTDEGAAAMAFGLNAGGGAGAGWTGQANATAAAITINAANGRYVAVGTIPATAKEVGIALCFTPVGTAGANDYIAFSGIQLVRNPSLASKVSTTVGYDCSGTTPVIQCSAFDRRLQGVEQLLQQRYYYKLAESAAVTPVGTCGNSTTSLALCLVQFPVTMRTAPTMAYTTGFAANTTTAMTAVTACTSLATSTAVASTAANVKNVMVACGSSAGFGAAGTTSFLYSNAGSGVIQASAEL